MSTSRWARPVRVSLPVGSRRPLTDPASRNRPGRPSRSTSRLTTESTSGTRSYSSTKTKPERPPTAPAGSSATSLAVAGSSRSSHRADPATGSAPQQRRFARPPGPLHQDGRLLTHGRLHEPLCKALDVCIDPYLHPVSSRNVRSLLTISSRPYHSDRPTLDRGSSRETTCRCSARSLMGPLALPRGHCPFHKRLEGLPGGALLAPLRRLPRPLLYSAA